MPVTISEPFVCIWTHEFVFVKPYAPANRMLMLTLVPAALQSDTYILRTQLSVRAFSETPHSPDTRGW